MKLLAKRILYIIVWIVMVIIAVPLAAVVLTVAFCTSLPCIFWGSWPIKQIPVVKVKPYETVADSNFSQN